MRKTSSCEGGRQGPKTSRGKKQQEDGARIKPGEGELQWHRSREKGRTNNRERYDWKRKERGDQGIMKKGKGELLTGQWGKEPDAQWSLSYVEELSSIGWWQQIQWVSQVVRNSSAKQEMQETQILSLGQEDPREKEMATTPVFLSEKSHGQRSQAGHSPWDHKELDTTEQLSMYTSEPSGWPRRTKRLAS